jgi:hypothetical protein
MCMHNALKYRGPWSNKETTEKSSLHNLLQIPPAKEGYCVRGGGGVNCDPLPFPRPIS